MVVTLHSHAGAWERGSLLVAESKPEAKETPIALIMNMLATYEEGEK
jgi:hypothetical protein